MAGMCYWPSFDAGGPAGLDHVAAPCSDSGMVTDAVMWVVSGGTMRVAVSTEASTPYFASPHATFEFSDTDDVVRKSLYDPSIYVPWDGPSPLIVGQGQPLYIELDGYGGDPFFFALMIGVDPASRGELHIQPGPSGNLRLGRPRLRP